MSDRNKSSFFKPACAAIMMFVAAHAALAQTAPARRSILVDSADTLAGWTSTNTLSVDAQVKVRGVASLKSVGSGTDRFRKHLATPLDVSGMRYLSFWYYVDRPELLGSGSAGPGDVRITSSDRFNAQGLRWPFKDLHLQRGWNYVLLDIPGLALSATDPIDLRRVNFIDIIHNPTGSVTTRLDHMMFTNLEPRSSSYAEYLRLKRISLGTDVVQREDPTWAFLSANASGSAARVASCRALTLDLSHRSIFRASLQFMGVSANAATLDYAERQALTDHMCGTRTLSTTSLLSHLRQRAAADVLVTQEIATLFDSTLEGAAETKVRLFQTDLKRIFDYCGTNPVEVQTFMNSGAQPAGIAGSNVLFRNCSSTLGLIVQQIDPANPQASDRGGNYRQCMSTFEKQASACENPYSSPDDDFNRRLAAQPHTDQWKAELKEHVRQQLQDIHATTVQQAREWIDASHARANAPAALKPQLEALHEQLDVTRAKAYQAEQLQNQWMDRAMHPQPPRTDSVGPFPHPDNVMLDPWYWTYRYVSERFGAEKYEDVGAELKVLHDLCALDKLDPSCSLADDEWIPEPATVGDAPDAGQRCASMDLGDGQFSWFDRVKGPSGKAGQINEADRIDHCLCELFDRNYSSSLPGVNSPLAGPNCPSPEERAAQKCLENPYDEHDGIRPECKHLMQPVSTDTESLTARICKKINPGCNAPFLETDGTCGCGTINPAGVTFTLSCSTGIPNCSAVDGVPTADGCGCQPANSGANSCTPGGKDFYLTRDPTNDLKVRLFPDRANFARDALLVVKPGAHIVTPTMTRNQLTNPNQLAIRTVLLGSTYDPTSKIDVYCVNRTGGQRNTLVQRTMLSSLAKGTPTPLNVSLDATEQSACYGSSSSAKVNFEFFVDAKPAEQVAFYDILGELGNIKPPCVGYPPRPTPGPRPLTDWPVTWTLSDGTRFSPLFRAVGPVPQPTPALAPTLLCMNDGMIAPCP